MTSRPQDRPTAATTCPRCGGETTEAELTYSGCAVCQAEAAENAKQDAADLMEELGRQDIEIEDAIDRSAASEREWKPGDGYPLPPIESEFGTPLPEKLERTEPAAAQDRYMLISDEYSWDAVIAPDGGEVPREVAEAMLAHVGHTFGPDEPMEQRFRETEVTPNSSWDQQFTQDNAGPIHGWKVEE